jgi:hypothetical protein
MNLLNDTLYRRTRAAVAQSIHTADDFLTRLRRPSRHILFEAASPLSIAVFRPVLERLQRDPRIEFWFTTSDSSWDADRTFGTAGIAERVVTPRQARWMKFDGYVNTDFWNTTWLPRRARRIHLFHGVAGKYGLDAPMHIAPVVRSFDRVMFANEDRLRRYVEAGLVENGECAQLVGYPKADCLVDGSLDRRQIQETLGLDPALPTVLYAPTWSAHSSLNSIGAELLPALADLRANVILKLHDRSYDPRSRSEGSIDWRRQLESLCRSWRVHAALDADISRYLYVSDVLVTDHSSAGFEFMLLDRPLVVIDCPELVESARIADDKVRLLHGASTVVGRNAAAIARAVERALANPCALSAERRAAANRVFYRPGGATARAADCVYDVLGLPADAPISIPSGVLSASTTTTGTTHHV